MIEERAFAFLARIDEALPSFIIGLYAVGSAALRAWNPDTSDIDLVALTSRAATERDLAALAAIHEGLCERPYLDCVYISPEMAVSMPIDQPVAPFSADGRLVVGQPCRELNPVLLLTLSRYGIALRGPPIGTLGIRVSPADLRAYNLDNLRTYWRNTAAAIQAYARDADPTERAAPEAVAWVLLGPARLHHTLAFGR